MRNCDACGRLREDTDLATVEWHDMTFYFCHGVTDEGRTCYMMARPRDVVNGWLGANP